jgi:hypothetical protein
MNLYGGPQTALTIALYVELYLAIILTWNPLLSHYNGPFYRTTNCPYYSLTLRRLFCRYIGTVWKAPHCPTIALHGGL